MAKIKKRLFGFIICFSLLFAFGFSLFAAKIQPSVCLAATAEQVEVLAETPTEDVVDETEKQEENHTFIGRVQEYIKTNYPEIAATVGNVVLLILMIVQYVKNKKKLFTIDSSVNKQTNTQSQIVDVVNGLIKGYNEIEQKLADSGVTEDDRINIKTLIMQTRAVLDILTTVYANSKNIPQGVKDLVNLKYANCLKFVEDKNEIKEVVIESDKEEVSAEETQKSETEV